MRWKKLLFWASALLSVGADQLTKFWVTQNFELRRPPAQPDTWPLIQNVFHFTYVTNDGAAFSLFKDSPLLPWLSFLVCLGLIGLGLFGPRFPQWEQAGYGFLLGGAAGNGIDRIFLGEVIDFLDFRLIQFPVFNIADISINVGLACLIFATWKSSRKGSRKTPTP
ncbi:signal peptidase II [Acaryochloris sp. CCMEE 5410]|uniref:signal peptidase II n=1 Tax=Acaryochloris sp. CCMEE 5410 TaxID=310037 RepID=UPI0002484409|nr:signal peptidase II [Acaryochloris sp. CCMEE 5410]KAI9135270.1 lipoprotein signal peptidase [Acaryochloris sp. CCMEE 5410]